MGKYNLKQYLFRMKNSDYMNSSLNFYNHILELITEANNLEELTKWVKRERNILQIKIDEFSVQDTWGVEL